MTEPKEPTEGAPHVLSWGYLVYQQIAGILGAFALIAFLSHFAHFDWRGALAELVEVWDATVRPVVKLLFDYTLVALCKFIFGWVLTVPQIVHDYVAVGFVFALSFARAKIATDRGWFEGFKPSDYWFFYVGDGSFWLQTAFMIFAWPLCVPLLIFDEIEFPPDREELLMVTLWLSPVLYCLVLVAANDILL